MSVESLRWAYTTRGLHLSQHALLTCLCWHHNADTGRCDPSQQTLAEETGMDARTVRSATAALVAAGLIVPERHAHQRLTYTLNIGRAADLGSGAQKAEQRISDPVLRQHNVDRAPDPRSGEHRILDPVAPDPRSAEPKGKQEEPKVDLPFATLTPDQRGCTPKISPAEQPPKPPRRPRNPNPDEQRVNTIFADLVETLRARGWTVTTTAGQRHAIANLCRRHSADRVAQVFEHLPSVNGKWPMNSRTLSALVSAAGFDALAAQVPAGRYDWPEEDPDHDPFT